MKIENTTDIVKSNMVIAEFMGIPTIKTAGGGLLYSIDSYNLLPLSVFISVGKKEMGIETKLLKYTAEQLIFNTSWDWLMPVVEKISKMTLPDPDGASEEWQPFPRTFGMVNEDTGNFMFRFNRHVLHEAPTLLEAAFSAVTDFISSNTITTREDKP